MIDPATRLAALLDPGLSTHGKLDLLTRTLAQAWEDGQEAYNDDILSGEDTPNPFRRTA